MNYIDEIREYQEFAEEVRQQLEQQFQYMMFTGDLTGAHEILKQMMAYGVIEKNDSRCSVRTKMFEGDDGVDVRDPSNWGQFDYRRKSDTGFIPRYLFAKNIANHYNFKVDVLEHWGVRVEGNYSGDIRISRDPMTIRISQDNSFGKARRDFEEICKVYKASTNDKHEFPGQKPMLALINAGVVRVFEIEVVGPIISKYRTLGYVLLKLDNNGKLAARTILKYEALYNSWIDIKDFLKNLDVGIRKIINGEVHVQHVIPPKKALEIQEYKCKETQRMDMKQLEIHKKQMEEYKAKMEAEAEKKAQMAAKEARKAEKLNEKLARANAGLNAAFNAVDAISE